MLSARAIASFARYFQLRYSEPESEGTDDEDRSLHSDTEIESFSALAAADL
jgi:hypothetical protein